MKKILIVMSVAIIMALFSAPSLVKAYDSIGTVFINNTFYDRYFVSELYTSTATQILSCAVYRSDFIYGYDSTGTGYPLYFYDSSESDPYRYCNEYCSSIYIDGFPTTQTLTMYGKTITIYGDIDDFYESIPEEFRPIEPSLAEEIWDSFYDLFEFIFGYRPMPGSIYDLLRGNAEDDFTYITFPTLTPTPTPTPTPTQIPVQTIFVPDGNGNTTIIYQYPDPTSGVITQSPYNPNIENNITVNCDCDGDGGGSGTFTSNPQDPYTLDASLLWADGFGVEMSENPLTTVNETQQTLNEAAMEYAESVNVLSNSFNIIPIKWLTLVGLCGGILIIAGLIRTFLGG